MPWNETTRKQHARNTGRYESDLTDAERELLEPLLPPSRRGRPRKVDLREVTNAILHRETCKIPRSRGFFCRSRRISLASGAAP